VVSERYVLRTYAFAYLYKPDEMPLQQKSIERWISLHSVKLEGWFVDKTARRARLNAMLESLVTFHQPIDYVLVYSPAQLPTHSVRSFQKQCEAARARVVYTSR
jgi:hypothetical protein